MVIAQHSLSVADEHCAVVSIRTLVKRSRERDAASRCPAAFDMNVAHPPRHLDGIKDFSIEQVRALVAIVHDPKRSCMDARNMAAEHLTAVRAKMRELRALERSLIAFVKSCDTSCAGEPGPECVILDDLAKPTTSDCHRARRVSSPS